MNSGRLAGIIQGMKAIAPLPQTDTRTQPLTVKVTSDERQELTSRAAAAGIPLGAYLRACGLSGQVVQTHPIAADQWNDLCRLAGNINSLTRLGHQGRLHPDSHDVIATLVELQAVLGQVRSSLISA